MARRNDLGFTPLKVEGGLLPPEFLRTVADLQAGDQDNASYGLTRSFNLRDEIGRFFRIASDLFADFRASRSATTDHSPASAVDRWSTQGKRMPRLLRTLAPFLTQALGFTDLQPIQPVTLGERTFPLTHRACKGAAPLVLLPPGFDLDKACPQCGEEGRRRTPWGLVQEYLNASDDALWGLVSNGLTLRILRDNPSLTRPAWIELDLERTFEDEVFSDFAAFWLLAHASRFEPRDAGRPSSCILERWRGKAHETGERARGELRKGVAKALVTLGNGFITHSANDALRRRLQDGALKPVDLHQQLLRLVYRCLFLLTIEDRDLLHPPQTSDEARQLWHDGYSIAQLRERALRPRAFDAHADLWQGLKISWMALEQAAPEIGAPALGGLFDRRQTPDVFAAELINAALLGAIKALAFFTPAGSKSLARINYRDMNTEEFGSVYESLLELHPFVEQAPWAFGYVGLNGDATKGTERKLSGSYYTPDSLVQELIKSALEPVIRKTATDHPYNQRDALLGLKVVDPACGSGHFLLAAARRIASEIARIEAAPDAPSEAQRQHALREVVQRCIYGVDKNPLAVELCKTALWIETVEPGKPLSFLDHRIRLGDSLIGVFDLVVLKAGIPDAAYTAKTGDDKKAAADLKKRNKEERKGQRTLGLSPPQIQAVRAELAKAGRALEAQGEDDAAAVAHKAQVFERLHGSDGWRRLKDACDLWTAAFFAKLQGPAPGQPERIPTTDAVREALAGQTLQALRVLLLELEELHFFHWPLEFPEVFDPLRPKTERGFDVVLGNPPWERIKLQEQEFFAERHNGIAKAPNKAARDKLIKALLASDNAADRNLHVEFEAAKHAADAASVFVRGAERYPLTAIGDVNTYAIFAETFLRLINERGRAGVIVPTGIASDHLTKAFFEEVMSNGRLASLFDFENRDAIFPSVHRSYKFCLLTLASQVVEPHFAFFLTETDQLSDQRRRFTLTADDIALLNPNTRTSPIFRTEQDAELTKQIYRRSGIFRDFAKQNGDPWHENLSRIFDMGKRREQELAAQSDPDNSYHLYEAKYFGQYDHRAASASQDGEKNVSDDQKKLPGFIIATTFLMDHEEVEHRLVANRATHSWLLAYRNIARSTDERTIIASILPRCATNYSIRLLISDARPDLQACLLGCLNSIGADYIAKQKLGGANMSDYVFRQLALLPPGSYSEADVGFIVTRVLELTYTAWDMQPFAKDLGYDGEPFHWDPERRAVLRAELDAYYAWLYGLTRDQLCYVLDPKEVMGEDFPSETFRVLKEREEKPPPQGFGEYRTRRLVLEAFDRLHEDGTFDPARVRDPHYFDAITKQLATATTELHMTKAELEETKRTLASLMSRADRDARPTLFVEGSTDAPVIEAAWRVLFPHEPMPFKTEPAGGTTQMKCLAAPGKTLLSILGDRLVMALADNDGEGRDLWKEKSIYKGGIWKRQTNGVWWCLLLPSEEFRKVMERFEIEPPLLAFHDRERISGRIAPEGPR
jgi:hypothetical protein